MSHSAHIFTNFGFFSAPVKSRAPAPAVPRATWIVRDIFRQHLAPKIPHSVRETRPFRLYKRSPALSRSVCRMKRWGNNDVHSWCPLLPPGRCPPHGDTLPEARWPEKQTRCRGRPLQWGVALIGRGGGRTETTSPCKRAGAAALATRQLTLLRRDPCLSPAVSCG